MDLTQFVAEKLFGIHTFLAQLSGNELFRLEQQEADAVGKSIVKLASFYDLPGVSAKTVAWIDLMTTLGTVYGGRLFAAKAMREAANANKPTVKVDANTPEPPRPQAPPGHVWASPGPGLPRVLMPN